MTSARLPQPHAHDSGAWVIPRDGWTAVYTPHFRQRLEERAHLLDGQPLPLEAMWTAAQEHPRNQNLIARVGYAHVVFTRSYQVDTKHDALVLVTLSQLVGSVRLWFQERSGAVVRVTLPRRKP